MRYKKYIKQIIVLIANTLLLHSLHATNYTVSTKTDLQNKMNAAVPGDTVIVANGTYNNWGSITFTNNNGTSSSAWIVLKAQSFKGVTFTGSAYIQFKGTHVRIDGFVFANGNAGTNAVISFRSSSSNLANYCRISNIIIDNFNTPSVDSSTENEWIGLYGTNNRIDHCSFINKYNARATVVVWYSSTTYPNPAISTYHLIDSNYFNGRSYMGDNGGECMRIGDSNASRTNGFNTIEYNLFENCTQTEPEIVSNKSDFNTYRYNTFKNCNGGLTLRHGRYCSVYSNFFIVDDATKTRSYGIRVIDKGHKIYNNYLEGLLGNKNSLTALRCPIILYNGLTNSNDTTDADKASGYFPADSVVVAFNTIVNSVGGAGIVLGFTDAGDNTFQPKGIVVANNLIKMSSGQAAYIDPANTLLTYTAEGNMYNAPNGLGLSSSTGFSNQTLSFGSRTNGILTPPSLVQDAAINTNNYSSLLNGLDAQIKSRSSVYDVGSIELNGSGTVIASPVDSNLVGAGKPLTILPVDLIEFKTLFFNKIVNLSWIVSNEINFKQYEVEWSNDGNNFNSLTTINARGNSSLQSYSYQHFNPSLGNNYYRLKMIDNDGSYKYSMIKLVSVGKAITVSVYPNPSKDFITVDLNGSISSKAEILLIDNAGRTVQKFSNLSSHSIKIPTTNLITGMYYIQLTQQGKQNINYPFMVNH
jgi:poly(beta-D-mannuronate) lyase